MRPRTTLRVSASAALTAGLFAGMAAALPTAPAGAAPANSYQMPFPCKQSWTGTTRSGHSPSSYAIDWNRPGTRRMCRVPSQKISTIAAVARNWIRWIRLMTRSPIWKTASGKNSSIEGPWNSPSSADLAIRVAAWVNSAGSSFGAPVRTGATMVGVLHSASARGRAAGTPQHYQNPRVP